MQTDKFLTTYLFVTLAYWIFMLSDGALRMLVLLHFHALGYSPIQLAYMFVLYELAGVITNILAGWIGSRYGLSTTLIAGLALQIVALLALSQLHQDWVLAYSVTYVMFVQGLSGIAKDLSKMSAKSAVKVLSPDDNQKLFRWVATLTGSKNAVKGLGFFIGAIALNFFSFVSVLYGMALVLLIVLFSSLILISNKLPKGQSGSKFKEIFSNNANINWLSFSRIFLFGARDVWFVVGVPIYFYTFLSQQNSAVNDFAFFIVGSFMAIWIIFYGIIQALVPKLKFVRNKTEKQLLEAPFRWIIILSLVPISLSLLLFLIDRTSVSSLVIMVIGLLVFAVLFAINSSLHSYLILSFTNTKRVSRDVGFYYMSNALGRLFGTILSGITYQASGLWLCLATSGFMLLISGIGAKNLK
tara:strand:+ start:359 stop:1597 length:1239 start_codon:yes stop_codon:yes gene_type:complete